MLAYFGLLFKINVMFYIILQTLNWFKKRAIENFILKSKKNIFL